MLEPRQVFFGGDEVSEIEARLLNLFRGLSERDQRVTIQYMEMLPKVDRVEELPALFLIEGGASLGFVGLQSGNRQDSVAPVLVASRVESNQLGEFASG